MEETVRDAVFGNVGTTIAFRVGPFDAELLETVFSPKFTKEDLVNLGFTQIYLTLMIDGVGSPPFSAMTIPPIDPPSRSYKKEVVASSRMQFAGKRAEIEHAIFEELKQAEAEAAREGNGAGKSQSGPRFTSGNGSERPPRAPRSFNTDEPQRERPRAPRRDTSHAVSPQKKEFQKIEQSPTQKTEDRPTPSVSDLKATLHTLIQKKEKNDSVKEKKKEGSLRDALAGVLKDNSSLLLDTKDHKKSDGETERQNGEAGQHKRMPVRDEKHKPTEVSEEVLRKILKDDTP